MKTNMQEVSAQPSRKLKILVLLVGLGITLYGLKCLVCLSDFSAYTYLFKYLPEKIIKFRYVISMSNRTLWFVAGIGILARSDIFRKLLIVICVTTIATMYWKHPLPCFMSVVDVLQANGSLPKAYCGDPERFGRLLMYYNYWLDGAFSVLLIYFFTRKNVKVLFR